MKIVKQMSRSVYPFSYEVKGSFNLGEICPIGAPIEVVPYDEFKAKLAVVLRMATPIAPIMDDLDVEITAHYVPLRLIGNANGDYTNSGYAAGSLLHTFEELIGNGYGNPADWSRTSNQIYTAPTAQWSPASARNAGYTTIGEALGLGLGINGMGTKNVLAYPLYGYNLIYQERFRNQDVEASKTNLAYGSNLYGVSGTPTATTGNDASYNHALSVAYKHGDEYTNGKPSPTKGAAVAIPLGSYAPLVDNGSTYNINTIGTTTLSTNGLMVGSTTTLNTYNRLGVSGGSGSGQRNVVGDGNTTSFTPSGQINKINLVADLTAATAATVNQFIEAYNIQQLLMKDIKGTRYYEIIKNHFGIENDDIRLYIPELLNINRFAINISPVVQQSGANTGTSTTDQNNILGTTGGYSFTANNSDMVHHAFGEYGYIYFLIVIRQKHTYGQGIPKLYLRSKRFDFFWPELGRVGYQKIMNAQLNADETSLTTGVFAYEPAWEELRKVNHNQVFGLLNPTKANSLDYWTLAENLTATPTLGMNFLKENRTNLARALTIADQGPDFIMDAVIYGQKSTLVPVGDIPKLFR